MLLAHAHTAQKKLMNSVSPFYYQENVSTDVYVLWAEISSQPGDTGR